MTSPAGTLGERSLRPIERSPTTTHPSGAATMLAMLTLTALLAQDKGEGASIKPFEAADHIGKKVVVIMTVKSSHFAEKSRTTFLNSEKDFKSGKNLQVTIMKDNLEKFEEMKIKEPHKHFLNKKVKITGKISEFRGKPELKLTDPDQIQIVEGSDSAEKSDDKPGEEKPADKSKKRKPAKDDEG
jgi:DNA/RNA endonuclease YhcR with UshA esterase domain